MFGFFKRQKDYNLVKKEIMSGNSYPILCNSKDDRIYYFKCTYKGQEVPCTGVLILNYDFSRFNDIEYIDGVPCFKKEELKKKAKK